MRSDIMKTGPERAPQRSLLKAAGYSDNEIKKPLIGVVNSFNEIVPGHVHLERISRAVKDGVLAAGGTPMEFNTVAVCDGLAMGHEGMKYSLVTREIIADSVECMVKAHALDGLVFIPNCDKIVPGMLMAACRLNIPAIFVSGGDASCCDEAVSFYRNVIVNRLHWNDKGLLLAPGTSAPGFDLEAGGFIQKACDLGASIR